MGNKDDNRFQDFYEEDRYTVLKNHLYNYRLRKRAVEKSLDSDENSLMLEVGSGISPVMTQTDRIVYSEISLTALKMLKETNQKGMYVVADALDLPFKPATFTHTISSEVLEHIEKDKEVVKELTKVMKPGGTFTVTFPHRKFYFANDDRFVEHCRRYELDEMKEILNDAGLSVVDVKKVLGPLEKITMSFIVFCFTLMQKFKRKDDKVNKGSKQGSLASLFKLLNYIYIPVVWLDAKIMPRALSTTLLIKSTLEDKR